MPKVKILTPVERRSPTSGLFEQLAPGTEADVTEQEFAFFQKQKAVELVKAQAGQPADVSNVVEAAHNASPAPVATKADKVK